MSLELTILGSNSAKPVYNRFTTSQYLKTDKNAFLIDAGEGVQIQLSKFRLKANRISKVFISHLHGDHILGLPGFLTSLSLESRTKPIEIYSPKGVQEWIESFLKISSSHISFPISYHVLEDQNLSLIAETNDCEIRSFPVVHRVPTFGFLFTTKEKQFNLRPEKIQEFDLSIEEIKLIKQGQDIIRVGNTITNSDLVYPKKPPSSYAYCADTIFTKTLNQFIQSVDLLYHEATYLDELSKLAKERLHSTSKEAAQIANLVKAKKLIIGHYSGRYKDLNPLIEEARSVFDNSHLAIEGETHFV